MTLLEFFCGGGMARAGLDPGWTCSFANDNDPRKAAAYATNWTRARFIVAADAGARIPAELVANEPMVPFHPPALVAASKRQRDPLWWRLPVPPMRNSTFAAKCAGKRIVGGTVPAHPCRRCGRKGPTPRFASARSRDAFGFPPADPVARRS